MAEGFKLGKPALVCRWRLAGRSVPLLDRHMRALSQRRVQGEPLTVNLLGWVKQHIEWSLAEDPSAVADGVLMLVVDEDGQAAMSTGAYEPLADASAEALIERAVAARAEADATGIAPELLCCVRDGALALGATESSARSGAATFIRQLAETRGHAVSFDPALPERARIGIAGTLALISDEHGVVVEAVSDDAGEAADAAADDELLTFLSSSFDKLRDSVR